MCVCVCVIVRAKIGLLITFDVARTFRGPPGCGKTTVARIISKMTKSRFVELSATSHGAADVKKAFEGAKGHLSLTGQKTIVFIDEIHRFTKAQQDLFLPYVEQGTIHLIGATTENPR